jgi:hypothetical protein
MGGISSAHVFESILPNDFPLKYLVFVFAIVDGKSGSN